MHMGKPLRGTMAHNYLLLTEEYLPNPDASGVCAHNLAKEIVHRGNTVTILCRRKYHLPKVETIEGIDVYGIYRTALLDKNNRSLLPRLFRRLSFILHLPLYPIKSLSYLVRMIQQSKRIIKQESIDCVIALNHPMESCLTEAVLKRKYKDIHFCVYDVDSFSNKIGDRLIPYSIQQKLFWRWERWVLAQVDQMIIMDNHAKHYQGDRYIQYSQKFDYANFPTLVIENYKNPKQDDVNTLCIHLGTLSKVYRNPEKVCETFLRLRNYALHFYGNTDDKELLERFAGTSQGTITLHGPVSFERGQQLLQEADVLISIGNAKSEMVPSKIFEYISYGKPILHFYSFLEDPVISYLKHYPLALLVNEQESIESISQEISSFIEVNRGRRVKKSEILEKYQKNTPEFSLDLIERRLR